MSEGSPRSEDAGAGAGGGGPNAESSVKEQDRFLPIANVSRIMKKALPPNAKISKDAKETVQECVSEFISFITGEASDKCQREKRKTINGDDLLWAMSTLGFEYYVEPLKLYLHKYRELEGEKTTLAKHTSASSSGAPGDHSPSASTSTGPPQSPSAASKFSSAMYYAQYPQQQRASGGGGGPEQQQRSQW